MRFMLCTIKADHIVKDIGKVEVKVLLRANFLFSAEKILQVRSYLEAIACPLKYKVHWIGPF